MNNSHPPLFGSRGVIAAVAVMASLLIISGCASFGNVAPKTTDIEPVALDVGNAIREAISMAGVEQSALAPQVTGSLSIQRQKWADNLYYGPGPLADEQSWNNIGALSLSYHLDIWDKDKNAARRSLDVAHATAADARAAQLELRGNVIHAYIEMSMNYALLDIARQTLHQQLEIRSLAGRRLKGGLGTQLEVSQAETPIPAYERQIESFDERIALDRNQLAELAGKGPGAASAGYDVAVESYNESIINALKDISDHVIRMRSLSSQTDDANRSLAAARKNYELSRKSYERGVTDYLNVLVGQNQLLLAQQDVAKIRAERLGAYAYLVAALGGGLDDPADGPPASEMRPAHRNGNAISESGSPIVKVMRSAVETAVTE